MAAVISEHIQITPGTCGGKPHIEETRQHIRESEAFATQLAATTPSTLKKKLEERNARAD